MAGPSPEKAGVGGSIPSLATTLSCLKSAFADHVAYSQPRIPHQEHHRASSKPFVSGPAGFFAGCDDPNDFVGGEGLYVVGF